MFSKSTSFKHSVQTFFGAVAPPSDAQKAERMEHIRCAMLSSLGPVGGQQYPLLERRIMYCRDIESLWFMRGDLLLALAMMHGELVARHRVESLREMFQGLIPEALNSRPSPLEDI